MQKIHANKIQLNFGHPKEDRMCVTENHLHYIIKAMLYFFVVLRCGKNKYEIDKQSGGGELPQAGQYDTPISYLTKEAKLWRF